MTRESTTTPKLSIVIVNWNSLEYLKQCLATIDRDTSVQPIEIIVVDGGSYDGCGEYLKEHRSDIRFIQADDNIGFARSNNLSIEHIHGDYTLLLNPDTEIEPGTFATLLAAHINLEKPGILCPKLLNTNGSHQTSCVQAFPTPLNQALDSNFLRKLFPKSRLWGTHAAFNSQEAIEVPAVSGACMLMTTHLFKELNGFDKSFFMYAEDMDICKRSKTLGYANYYFPKVKVTHHGGGSSSTAPSEFSINALCRSLFHYLRLHHSNETAQRYKIFMMFSSVIRLTALYLAFIIVIPSKTKKSAVQSSILKWKTILNWTLLSDKP